MARHDMNFDSRDKILVFGGPYSNLQATLAMRDEADRLGIAAHNVICTGDVVAYAAEPEETVNAIRAWGVHVIAGNCEEQLADGAEDCGCGFEEGSVCDVLSRGWYPYAAAHISESSRQWMRGLARSMTFRYGGKRFHVLHGGGRQTNRFIFESDDAAMAQEVRALDADVVLAGHAGIPFIARTGRATWVNAGVIGIPANDGTPDVWYAIVQAEAVHVRISLRRLSYDYISAAAAMRRAGHANGYARAIVTGIWPSHDILPPAELDQTGAKLRQKTVRLGRERVAAGA